MEHSNRHLFRTITYASSAASLQCTRNRLESFSRASEISGRLLDGYRSSLPRVISLRQLRIRKRYYEHHQQVLPRIDDLLPAGKRALHGRGGYDRVGHYCEFAEH